MKQVLKIIGTIFYVAIVTSIITLLYIFVGGSS